MVRHNQAWAAGDKAQVMRDSMHEVKNGDGVSHRVQGGQLRSCEGSAGGRSTEGRQGAMLSGRGARPNSTPNRPPPVGVRHNMHIPRAPEARLAHVRVAIPLGGGEGAGGDRRAGVGSSAEHILITTPGGQLAVPQWQGLRAGVLTRSRHAGAREDQRQSVQSQLVDVVNTNLPTNRGAQGIRGDEGGG